MSVSYIEYSFTISPLQSTSDILMAELGEEGFESFVEKEEGLLAYIPKKNWREGMLENIRILNNSKSDILYDCKEIPQENWNANWERSFSPIQIDDRCAVRAPFHAKPDAEYDIVIEPKMSFGTGHHETTHMMLQFILDHDLEGTSVLDMGSGTGVLAILAAMKGAGCIDAIDIDNWCYLNAKENVGRNGVPHINVYEGDADLLSDGIPKAPKLVSDGIAVPDDFSPSDNTAQFGKMKYDTILANINRNILLKDIPIYARNLTKNGTLFVSGFYADDLELISKKCAENGLRFKKNLEKNQWVAAKYVF
ncbi:MAG: 50S ribosomal protein L11 methyltransferase [Pricia sp.]